MNLGIYTYLMEMKGCQYAGKPLMILIHINLKVTQTLFYMQLDNMYINKTL